MKKLNIKWIALAVGCGLFLNGCSWRHKSPQEKMQVMTGYVESRLDLQPNQKAELDKLGQLLAKTAEEFRSKRQENITFAISQIEDDAIDEKALLSLLNERVSKVDQSLPAITKQLAVFHSTLNAEQKNKIAEKLRDRIDH